MSNIMLEIAKVIKEKGLTYEQVRDLVLSSSSSCKSHNNSVGSHFNNDISHNNS